MRAVECVRFAKANHKPNADDKYAYLSTAIRKISDWKVGNVRVVRDRRRHTREDGVFEENFHRCKLLVIDENNAKMTTPLYTTLALAEALAHNTLLRAGTEPDDDSPQPPPLDALRATAREAYDGDESLVDALLAASAHELMRALVCDDESRVALPLMTAFVTRRAADAAAPLSVVGYALALDPAPFRRLLAEVRDGVRTHLDAIIAAQRRSSSSSSNGESKRARIEGPIDEMLSIAASHRDIAPENIGVLQLWWNYEIRAPPLLVADWWAPSVAVAIDDNERALRARAPKKFASCALEAWRRSRPSARNRGYCVFFGIVCVPTVTSSWLTLSTSRLNQTRCGVEREARIFQIMYESFDFASKLKFDGQRVTYAPNIDVFLRTLAPRNVLLDESFFRALAEDANASTRVQIVRALAPTRTCAPVRFISAVSCGAPTDRYGVDVPLSVGVDAMVHFVIDESQHAGTNFGQLAAALTSFDRVNVLRRLVHRFDENDDSNALRVRRTKATALFGALLPLRYRELFGDVIELHTVLDTNEERLDTFLDYVGCTSEPDDIE